MAWFLATHSLGEAGVENWVDQQARGRQPGSCSLAGTPGGGTGWDSLGGAPASTVGRGAGVVDTQRPMFGWHIFPTYDWCCIALGWENPGTAVTLPPLC